MYLPRDDAQMFDILSELRTYAQLNALPGLAEELDDALIVLAVETQRRKHKPHVPCAEDRR